MEKLFEVPLDLLLFVLSVWDSLVPVLSDVPWDVENPQVSDSLQLDDVECELPLPDEEEYPSPLLPELEL